MTIISPQEEDWRRALFDKSVPIIPSTPNRHMTSSTYRIGNLSINVMSKNPKALRITPYTVSMDSSDGRGGHCWTSDTTAITNVQHTTGVNCRFMSLSIARGLSLSRHKDKKVQK
eukprot:Hpha_TRINITY_DN15717_c2_g2::TRINITY_DN15717_c2_g2_i1::g.36626::m.36626